MNISDMHVAVNIGVQKIASYALDDFLPEEIDYYLNRAIGDYVRIQKDTLRARDGGEAGQGSMENLRTLINTKVFTTAVGGGLSAVSEISTAMKADLTVATDYQYYVSSRARVDSTGIWKNNRLVSQDVFFDYGQTKSNAPIYRDLPAVLIGDHLYVMRDKTDATLDQVHLVYLRLPIRVNFTTDVSCDLPAHTHEDIVQQAIQYMLVDLEKKRGGGE